jgi:hypothetical protein
MVGPLCALPLLSSEVLQAPIETVWPQAITQTCVVGRATDSSENVPIDSASGDNQPG